MSKLPVPVAEPTLEDDRELGMHGHFARLVPLSVLRLQRLIVVLRVYGERAQRIGIAVPIAKASPTHLALAHAGEERERVPDTKVGRDFLVADERRDFLCRVRRAKRSPRATLEGPAREHARIEVEQFGEARVSQRRSDRAVHVRDCLRRQQPAGRLAHGRLEFLDELQEMFRPQLVQRHRRKPRAREHVPPNVAGLVVRIARGALLDPRGDPLTRRRCRAQLRRLIRPKLDFALTLSPKTLGRARDLASMLPDPLALPREREPVDERTVGELASNDPHLCTTLEHDEAPPAVV